MLWVLRRRSQKSFWQWKYCSLRQYFQTFGMEYELRKVGWLLCQIGYTQRRRRPSCWIPLPWSACRRSYSRICCLDLERSHKRGFRQNSGHSPNCCWGIFLLYQRNSQHWLRLLDRQMKKNKDAEAERSCIVELWGLWTWRLWRKCCKPVQEDISWISSNNFSLAMPKAQIKFHLLKSLYF